MLSKLILLFIGLPLVEIVILVKLGEVLGFWMTIGVVVATGVIGATLAKMQGLMVYSRIQAELRGGRIPTNEMIDGLLILVGGIVLLTPGLLTDLFGFALLVPWIRNQFKGWLHQKFSTMAMRGETRIYSNWQDLPPSP